MSLVPLYRLQGNGDHFYTTSVTERDNAISEYGYTSEGVACYVHAAPSVDDEYLAECAIAVFAQLVSGRFYAGRYVGDPAINTPIDVAESLRMARLMVKALP